MRGFISGIGMIAVLGTSAGAQEARPAPMVESSPLANLTGTWIGGFTDSSGTMVRGLEASDTLTIMPDSSYSWTSKIDMAVDLRYLGKRKLKRLTATNVSWVGDTDFDAAGFDYKVEGDKLSLVSLKPDPNGGGKIYQAFGRVGGAAVPFRKMTIPVRPPAPSPSQMPAPSGALASLVGTWVGGPTDSSGVTYVGWGGTEMLTFNADSSYAWIRVVKERLQRSMVNGMHPGDYKWRRLTATNISWHGDPGYNYKLKGDTLFLVSVLPYQRWGTIIYLTLTRGNPSMLQGKLPPSPVITTATEAQFANALDLLNAGKFDTVETSYATLQDKFEKGQAREYELMDAYKIFHQGEDRYRNGLDGWIKAHPKSDVAYLARGVYFRKLGELRRGYAVQAQPENLQYMHEMFALAKKDLMASLHLNPKSYLAALQLLNIAEFERDEPAATKFLELGNAAFSSNLTARAQYLFFLAPWWGGSYQRMDKFIEDSRAQGLSQDRIDLLTAIKYEDQGKAAEKLRNPGQARLAYRKALGLSLSGGPRFRRDYLEYSMRLCREPEHRGEPYCQ